MDHARRACVALIVSVAGLPASAALAAELPAVKIGDGNQVAECATPGRLMAFLKANNSKLAPKFETIATEYMRHGEELKLRWEYAYFQMLLETGFLKYTGDVKPDQNNFAGLGATGKGARGESFKDVSTGVRAHLEHLLMYSGERVENPVAERTKNIQEWGVLTSWQKSITGPMTFSQLAKQWAPGSRKYGSDIDAISERFFNGQCKDADPAPEQVAEARKGRDGGKALETAAVPQKPAASKGDELARKALDDGRREGAAKAALGGGDLAAAASGADASKSKAPMSILNNASPADDKPAGDAAKAEKTALSAPSKPAATGKSDGAAEAPASGSCRVWTASYGGSRSVLIKAVTAGTTNYTVLDVNEGAEEKEASAYIAAYAKDGKKILDFPSQQEALDKAFALCPEG